MTAVADVPAVFTPASGAVDGNVVGLVHHADHGSNYVAMVYSERAVDPGATPSTGTVGDGHGSALAEAFNELYKAELIRQLGHLLTVESVDLATLEYVWWWNNWQLHSELDDADSHGG